MHEWNAFIHVLSGFMFFFAHGVSAFVMLKLPTEREGDRIKALLDLREMAAPWMGVSAGVLFLSGIVGGFLENYWGQIWIWAGLILLILISLPMTFMGRMYIERVRKALGLENRLPGSKPGVTEEPVSASELEKILAAGNARFLALFGLLGLFVIVYLMMFKPF